MNFYTGLQHRFRFLTIFFCLFVYLGHRAQAESDEARSVEDIDQALAHINEEFVRVRAALIDCYEQAHILEHAQAPASDFQPLLLKAKDLKAAQLDLDARWRALVLDETRKEDVDYAFWNREEVLLTELITEFGASDFLYIIPHELAAVRLSLHSSIPLPRNGWSDLLDVLFMHNGIGVKPINAYTRELYALKQQPFSVHKIVSKAEDLLFLDDLERILYVMAPPLERAKSAFQFFDRFADARHTFVYQVGTKIILVGAKSEIEKLMQLQQLFWGTSKGKTTRVVPLNKMPSREMEKILQAFFSEVSDRLRLPMPKVESEGLVIQALPQGNAIVLIGTEDLVDRAEKIVKDTEEQLLDPAEMTLFLYSCRHSNPEDLAQVLDKMYASLVLAPNEAPRELDFNYAAQGNRFSDNFQAPPLVVAPSPLQPQRSASLEIDSGITHFVPDLKTGGLLIVVRRSLLPKIKELLKKLDVPKKMVQIEVLLFEKKYQSQTSFGLNLLNLGAQQAPDPKASNWDNGFFWKSVVLPRGSGVLEFLFSADKSKYFPAWSTALSFMLAQEDVQLNAAPSLITVNQVPATISIVEEVSINNGAVPVENTNGNTDTLQSYTRAQYGTVITMTPSVHPIDEDASGDHLVELITLKANVTFDTPRSSSHDDRPDVDRRHIETEVTVPSGQTIILGGLRRKAAADAAEKVPFLGDIPGLGKLFGSTKLSDNSTEMFIFITPQVVDDSGSGLLRLRTEALKKRPGDTPEFLDVLIEQRARDRRSFFAQSMEIFSGRS